MSTHLKKSGFSTRNLIGIALIGVVLAVLPFVIGMAGQSWVRILNFALLYVMLALGLNIVVGFAGLLDLGYIAFYAVGAYVYALLASPHFNLHLPFWIILPIGAAFACLFGVLLGAPSSTPNRHATASAIGRIAQNGRCSPKCGEASSAHV